MGKKYDLVVIGGGPGGYYAAIHAAKQGASVALIEEEKVGGTCLNYGCIPTKVMLDAVAEISGHREYIQAYLNQEVMFLHRNQSIQKLRKGVEFLLKKNKVEVIYGHGKYLGSHELEVTLNNSDSISIEFEYSIIATGSVPRKLSIFDGFEAQVINSNQATNMMNVPDSICIVGGGVIGIEFASIYEGLGCKVTIIEALDRLLINEEAIVSEFVTDRFIKRGMKVITGAQIEHIQQENNQLIIRVSNENIVVDKLLCAVGRMPNVEGLNITVLDSNMVDNKGAIIVNEFMQTSCPNIYAIGDVTAGMMLAHVASAQAILAVDNIFLKTKRIWDKAYIPRCIYIEPEIAAVGMTEREAESAGPYKTALYPFSGNGKAVALGLEVGFIKVVTNMATNQILGITIVGPRATDLIAQGMEFIKNKLTVEDVEHGIYPHPTFSEALHEAILKINNKAVHG